MHPTAVQQITLYRFRKSIGYLLYLLALVALMTVQLGSLPNGISVAEMKTAIISGNTHFKLTTPLLDAPYHFLQAASFKIFDITPFSMRLPSAVLAITCGLLLLLLLRRWFNANVAIITSLLSVSGSLFLTAGRLGRPSIMLVFWSLLLLVLGSLIIQQARGTFVWKVLFAITLALMLYTPFSLYIIAAGGLAVLLHPHSRYIMLRFGKTELALGVLLASVLLTPLAMAIYKDFSLGISLLGIPASLPSLGMYIHNLGNIALALGGFLRPQIGEFIQPAFSVASILLIILGLLQMLKDNHALRTYAILFWLIAILPLLAFQPRAIIVIFVPFTLLMATGIQELITQWYTLFPRNPYARLAGLVPLVALIGGVGFLNYTTYFNGYRYSPDTISYYNSDLQLLQNQLDKPNLKQIPTVVSISGATSTEIAFYSLLPRYNPKLTVTSSPVSSNNPNTAYFVLNNQTALAQTNPVLGAPSHLVANANHNHSLRWLVYLK